jgi:hypothetical protein
MMLPVETEAGSVATQPCRGYRLLSRAISSGSLGRLKSKDVRAPQNLPARSSFICSSGSCISESR